jgi:hypothetical protein
MFSPLACCFSCGLYATIGESWGQLPLLLPQN